MTIFKIIFIALSVWCVSACSLFSALPVPSFLKSEEKLSAKSEPQMVNVIALLPVESDAADGKNVIMLRTKLCEELRFKGYPFVDTSLIDAKLMPLTEGKTIRKSNVIPPGVMEELVGADGVMYCTFSKSKKTKLFYAPVTVSVSCALRSAKTGETVWNASSTSTSRSVHLNRKTLEMKSKGDLEEAMEEAVSEVMETLPYGPRLRG